MPQKIEIQQIFPDNKSFLDLDIRRELRLTCADFQALPRPKKVKRNVRSANRTPIIGVIEVAGNFEDLDFRDSNVYKKAKKCDGIALWFDAAASMPCENAERSMFVEKFWTARDYHDLHSMIHMLIMGVEMQIIRRVIAIGTKIHIAENLKTEEAEILTEFSKEEIEKMHPTTGDGLFTILVPGEYRTEYRWMRIPKDRIPPKTVIEEAQPIA